jgi:uncharacterized protein (TIGR02118 family)
VPGVKLVVIYPRPKDPAAFERAYKGEHVPLVEAKLKGMTRFVATKVVSSLQGTSPTSHRIAEIHFSTLDALNECIGSDGGKEVIEHAKSISTGGPPIVWIAEEEIFTYW